MPYFKPAWKLAKTIPTCPVDLTKLLQSLVQCVQSQIMSEVPFGVLLSVGLDSNLIAASAKKLTPPGRKILSFCVEFGGSIDMKYAQPVADLLGTKHYAFPVTIDIARDMLRHVIYHVKTYDVTTIRASTPMFLLARHIKSFGVKMVLSGEGSDEIFGGYLYSHQAPDANAFHQECLT